MILRASAASSATTIPHTSSVEAIGKPPGVKIFQSQKLNKNINTKLIEVLQKPSNACSGISQHFLTFPESRVRAEIAVLHTPGHTVWTPNGTKPVVDIEAEQGGSDDEDEAV